MVVQAKSNTYVLAVSLASNSLLLSFISFSLCISDSLSTVEMERVMEEPACGVVAAAFWLAMMLFLSRCCVCVSAMKGGGMMGMRGEVAWSWTRIGGGATDRSITHSNSARDLWLRNRRHIRSCASKGCFLFVRLGAQKVARLELDRPLLAIPAEKGNYCQLWLLPSSLHTSPVHPLAFSSSHSQLQPQESIQPSGSCLDGSNQ